MSKINLGAVVGSDDKIAIFYNDDPKKKVYRKFAVDVREELSAGRSITIPGIGEGSGKTGKSDEDHSTGFDGLSLDALKIQYKAALDAGHDLESPKGNSGRKWYADVLTASGYKGKVALDGE